MGGGACLLEVINPQMNMLIFCPNLAARYLHTKTHTYIHTYKRYSNVKCIN